MTPKCTSLLYDTRGCSCRWVDGVGYQQLVHSARALKVDVILVLGQDKLHAELEKEFRKDGDAHKVCD